MLHAQYVQIMNKEMEKINNATDNSFNMQFWVQLHNSQYTLHIHTKISEKLIGQLSGYIFIQR